MNFTQSDKVLDHILFSLIFFRHTNIQLSRQTDNIIAVDALMMQCVFLVMFT